MRYEIEIDAIELDALPEGVDLATLKPAILSAIGERLSHSDSIGTAPVSAGDAGYAQQSAARGLVTDIANAVSRGIRS